MLQIVKKRSKLRSKGTNSSTHNAYYYSWLKENTHTKWTIITRLKFMSCDIWEQHPIDIYLSDLDSSSNSSSVGTISCYLKYLKCVRVLKFTTWNIVWEFNFWDIQVGIWVFSGSIFVRFLCPGQVTLSLTLMDYNITISMKIGWFFW
jgi:hypothetical protein